MSKKYFIDEIHAETDRMGGRRNQCPVIGWYDRNSNSYFNLNEVQDLFDKGEAENVAIDSKGILYMKQRYLDFRVAFRVICGIPFSIYEGHENLIQYAREIGIIQDQMTPVEMYCGTKSLEFEGDDLYTIKYQFKPDFFDSGTNFTFVEKMCVGRINRLRSETYRYCTKEGEEIRHYFICDKVEFDRDTLTLNIYGIPEKYVYKDELTSHIRNMDLEFLISDSSRVNFYNVLSACKDWCRDWGQYHMIGETASESQKKTNIYWYDKMS